MECSKDFDDWHEVSIHVQDYLTEQECEIYNRAHRLKHFILESALLGDNKINFKKMNEMGKMSEHDREIFKKELNS